MSLPLMSPDPITLSLKNSEALVLHSLLSRINKNSSLQFEDQSEQRVLWDLECLLEKQLVEPLSPTYKQYLADARALVRDKEE